MDTFLVAVIVAALGGAFSAFVGWLGSEEAFEPRKLCHGIIRGAIGGAALALGLQVQGTAKEYVLLFFSALGVDVSVNGVAKKLNVAEKLGIAGKNQP